MLKFHNPETIRAPFARYSHAVEFPAGWRIVMCSGQLGVQRDDVIPAETGAQARLCFDNIRHILASAGMGLSDIVRINAYVSGREHMAAYMAVRDELFSNPAPASTLMIVSGFTRPEFHVEIEAVAAAQ